MRLDEFQVGIQVKGLILNQVVTIRAVERYGEEAVDLTYLDEKGRLGYELLYQQDAESVERVKEDEHWAFDADGELFRLISEAYRICMAHLFDPLLAVHTSAIEPLPHQIAAVYEEMLPQHPLRFLLADDPGAGKTVMAGLLLKELILRGDVQRCLICAPGNLVEQWQEELFGKFQLSFRAISSHSFMEKVVGNPFQKHNWVICRLDHLSRNEQARSMFEQTEWDLIIVDEAHKMSASFFGGEFKATKRYRLGELFSKLTRHLLLLTATPHNGKEEDFQLFLNLLDEDRFAGRFRTGIRHVDVRDIMRRLTKEQLLTFQGCPLFPERRAHTVSYRLSPEEEALYEAVTHYVRDQWNRIERFKEKKRTVSFALTILQRRLASSPEGIYRSLLKRRTKLQKKLAMEKQKMGYYSHLLWRKRSRPMNGSWRKNKKARLSVKPLQRVRLLNWKPKSKFWNNWNNKPSVCVIAAKIASGKSFHFFCNKSMGPIITTFTMTTDNEKNWLFLRNIAIRWNILQKRFVRSSVAESLLL